MVIASFPELKTRLCGLPPKEAVVAAAHDEHTLQAVFAARRDGLIRPILVGRREEILSIAHGLGEELDPARVADAGDDAQCAAKSVELIRSGAGAMLIKGMLPTGTLLKAVVSRETGIRDSQVMSHVAILDVPGYHKLLYVTDGGMVVAPDLEQKRHILSNALDFCRFLGYDRPKAAVLCAVETVNPAMPETADGAVLKAAQPPPGPGSEQIGGVRVVRGHVGKLLGVGTGDKEEGQTADKLASGQLLIRQEFRLAGPDNAQRSQGQRGLGVPRGIGHVGIRGGDLHRLRRRSSSAFAPTGEQCTSDPDPDLEKNPKS